MADYDLEALSLTELKKMQKDVAKAISTYQDLGGRFFRADAAKAIHPALGVYETADTARDKK